MTREARIVVIVAGVVLLIGLLLPSLVSVDSFRPKLESELSAALGRQVKVGDLSFSLFSGSVSAGNVSIADDPAFGKEPFITAKSFRAAVQIRPLIFSKTLHITGIKLEEPQITFLRAPDGAWNFSSIGKGQQAHPPEQQPGEGSGGTLSVDKMTIENGRLLVGVANSAEKPAVYNNVAFEVTGFSSTTQFPFTLTALLPGGGDLSLEGKCGPVTAGNASATPFDAQLKVRKLDLAASGFVAPSTGIEGVADVDGAIQSIDQQVKASGTLKAEKLKLAAKGTPMKRTVEVKYALDHNLKTHAAALTQGEVAIGKAVARLTGNYQTQGQTATLDMKVNGNGMPVDDLEAALPALGVVLPSGSKLQGGTVSVDLAITGPSDKIVIAGPVRLSNAKLAGFDLGSKLSAIPALSGKQSGKDTTIQNLSATLRVSPEVAQADAINVEIPALGVVNGSGSVTSSGALDFAMRANLSGAARIEKTGLAGQDGGVPFSIQGTASDPKFVPDVKSMAGTAITRKVSSAIPDSPLTGKLGRRKK